MATTKGRAGVGAGQRYFACLARWICAGIFLMISSFEPPGAGDTKANPLIIMPPHPRVAQMIQSGAMSLPVLPSGEASGAGWGKGPRPASSQKLAGPVRSLAVLVSFSDQGWTTGAPFFDRLIFAPPGPQVSSVRSYYGEVSYSQVDIVTVNLPSSLGWIRAPQSERYYVGSGYCFRSAYPNNCQKLAEDVVDAVASRVDFSQYDNDQDGYAEPILIVHAGQGAEYTSRSGDIWSHSWALRNPRTYDGVRITNYVTMPEYWRAASATASDMTIGVFAHEMAHGFWRLPDLYDTDYSSSGIGDWSLLAGGSWNGPGGMGGSPAWPDAWSRIQMGFATATPVDSNPEGLLIPPAYGNPSRPTVFKVQDSSWDAMEYFLLENRQQDPGSYDRFLPGSGLLIWHIDEAGYANNWECRKTPDCTCEPDNHYAITLEQADGRRDLENGQNWGDAGDPFPGIENFHAFGSNTRPDSGSWYQCAPSTVRVVNINESGTWITTGDALPPSLPYQYYLPAVNGGAQSEP